MEGLATAEGSDAIQEKSEWVQYQKKPNTRLHDKDTNKKWTASGRTGYEFLNVVHLASRLSTSALHESLQNKLICRNTAPSTPTNSMVGFFYCNIAHYTKHTML